MKKRFYAAGTLVAIILLLPPWLLGFSVFNLGHAVQVATSLSAKLACSARYVSGMEPQQIMADLQTYSPATQLVELQYLDSPKRVSATLYGLASVTAEYRDALGCSLREENNVALAEVSLPSTSIVTTPTNKSWPLGSSAPNIDQDFQHQVTEHLINDNKAGLQTRALLMVKNGDIVAEAYAQDITKDTPLLGWSMAKSVTAMMVGAMDKIGLFDQEQTQLFPIRYEDDRTKIKLAQLLTMTSGLDFDETYAPGSDATHMLFTASSASDVALKSNLDKISGTHFSYSSGTTNLLTRLIHNTLGNSTESDQLFLRQKLFGPAQTSTAVFETDASGVLVGSSYLYASARDWARFGLIMLQQGRINDQQVLNRDWVARATQPNGSNNEKAYGYQFWLNKGDDNLRWPTLPEDAYAMMGNRKQSVMIIPSANVVFVRLGWTQGDYPMEETYRALLNSL